MKKTLVLISLLFIGLTGCVKETNTPTPPVIDESEPEIVLLGEPEITIQQNEEYIDAGILIDGVKQENPVTTTDLDRSVIGTYTYCYFVEDETYCRTIHVIESDSNHLLRVLTATDSYKNYKESLNVDIQFSYENTVETFYYEQRTDVTNLISKAVTTTNMMAENEITYTTYAKRYGDTFHFYTTEDDQMFDFSQENMNEEYRFLLTDLQLSDDYPITVSSAEELDGDIVYRLLLNSYHVRDLYSEGFFFLAGFDGTIPNDATVPATMIERNEEIIYVEINLTEVLDDYFEANMGVSIDYYTYRINLQDFDNVAVPDLPDAIK